MSNLKKKIVAVVMTVTLSVLLVGPGVAQGATVEELLAQITALQAQLTALQVQLAELQGETPTVTGCTITSFDRNLKQGMSGDDVKCLQIVLNTATDTQLAASGVGSSGNETSYFGPLTKAAVIKFQEKYASEVLASWGLTEGTGFVGTTTRAKLDALLGAVVVECTTSADCATGQVCQNNVCVAVEVPTAATVSKAVDSPAAGVAAQYSQDVLFLKLKFTAGSEAYTVSKVVVTRGGIATDADLTAVELYDGTTRVGSAQALSTTTHKATFSGLSWEVPASSVKYLDVKADIASTAENANIVGDSIQLGISVASDITSTVSLSGTFPVWSAAKTVAGISVGTLDVDAQSVPAAAYVLSGSTEQEIAAWRFAANVTEGFNVQSVKITQVGSAATGDISNLKLKYAGTQVGSTVASLEADNSATFDLSASPLTLNASTSKIIYAYADIALGIWTDRTVKFEITEYTDVTAFGANSGGSVTITCDSDDDGTGGDTFVKQTGQLMTVSQGTLQMSLDNAQNPAAQTYVKGTSNRLMTALKFSTGSREGVRISELKLTLATGDPTDIANVTLWDGTAQVAGPASVIGSYAKFGANTIGWDDPGVFDIAASTNKTILVRADIPTGAAGTVQLSLAASNVKADGLSSQYDVPSTAITGSATGSTHTIGVKGNLTVSVASDTPATQIYVNGDEDKEFTKINFSADSGEDIVVSAITVKAWNDMVGTTTALTSGDITNVKMMKSDGTQYGSTIATGTSSMSFSGSLTVAASSTESLTVVADIPTSSTADYVNIDVRDVSVGNYPDDVTATGVASSADIGTTYLSGSADGNYMTIGSGGLTLVVASTPADQPVIINATDIVYVGIAMTAGTAENVRATMIKLNRTSYADVIGGSAYTAGSDADISNIALYDALGNRLTTKKNLTSGAVTFSASDFLNSTGIDISKGQQTTVYVKADAPSTATSSKCNALGLSAASTGSYYDNVAATGLSSGSSLTTSDITLTSSPTGCDSGATDGINFTTGGDASCYQVGMMSAGALAVSENAGRPETARLAVGTLGTDYSTAVMYKVNLKAAYESIDVKSIQITRPTTCGGGAEACGRDSDFAQVQLYDGTTLLGSQNMVGGDITFNFASGSYWRIPSGVTEVLTIKGYVNGAAYAGGVLPGDYTKLCLAASGVTGQGVDSGSTSITITGLGSALCGQEQSLSMSVPTVAVGTLPSSVLSSGTMTIYKWTVSADSKGPVSWNRIAFQVTGMASQDGTMRSIGTDDVTTPHTDGIYTIVAGDSGANADKRIVSNLKIYRGTTQVNGTFYYRTDTDASAGTYVVFVPTAEEVVAAGESKTYTFQGDFTLVTTSAGVLGTVNTKVSNLSSDYDADLNIANTQRVGTYAIVRKNSAGASEDANSATTSTTNSRSFIWSDRSGCTPDQDCAAMTTHATTTYDWFSDYKVVGIPATTLTLTK